MSQSSLFLIDGKFEFWHAIHGQKSKYQNRPHCLSRRDCVTQNITSQSWAFVSPCMQKVAGGAFLPSVCPEFEQQFEKKSVLFVWLKGIMY